MLAFKGQYLVTVDKKSRVAIPAKFRFLNDDGSPGPFVLTGGFDKCLYLYPSFEWRKIEEASSGNPFATDIDRRLDRYLFGQAVDSVPDRQGRILIPQFLKKIGEIDQAVLFVGVSRRIEVWSPEVFEKYWTDSPAIEQVVEKLSKKIE